MHICTQSTPSIIAQEACKEATSHKQFMYASLPDPPSACEGLALRLAPKFPFIYSQVIMAFYVHAVGKTNYPLVLISIFLKNHPEHSIFLPLTLSTRSANILAHGLHTRSAMRQHIGTGDFTRVSSETK